MLQSAVKRRISQKLNLDAAPRAIVDIEGCGHCAGHGISTKTHGPLV